MLSSIRAASIRQYARSLKIYLNVAECSQLMPIGDSLAGSVIRFKEVVPVKKLWNLRRGGI